MKQTMTTLGLLLLVALISNFTTTNSTTTNSKKIIGTWEYTVPNAPYEYQEGELTIEEVDGELSGYTMVGDYKTDVEDLVIEDKNVTFTINIEDTEVSFDLDFDKNSFKGTVTYVEGTLTISGTKKE